MRSSDYEKSTEARLSRGSLLHSARRRKRMGADTSDHLPRPRRHRRRRRSRCGRFIQGIITKHSLAAQPVVVVNKSGGAGAEGFLEVKGSGANLTPSSSRFRTCSRRLSERAFPSTGRISRRSRCSPSTSSFCG